MGLWQQVAEAGKSRGGGGAFVTKETKSLSGQALAQRISGAAKMVDYYNNTKNRKAEKQERKVLESLKAERSSR